MSFTEITIPSYWGETTFYIIPFEAMPMIPAGNGGSVFKVLYGAQIALVLKGHEDAVLSPSLVEERSLVLKGEDFLYRVYSNGRNHHAPYQRDGFQLPPLK